MNEQVDYRSVIDRLVESGQLRDAAPATPAAPVAPVAPAVPIAPAAPMVPSTPPSGRTVDDYRAAIQQLPPETFEAAPSGEPAVRPSGVDLRLTRDALAGQGDLRLGPTVERAQLLGTTHMGPTPENARIASSAAAAQRMLGDVRPDVIADIRRLSRDMGIPVPLAAQTYLDRAQQERRRSYERLLQENPGLRAMAQRGSGYADFLEDARELATAETAFNALRSFGEAFPTVAAALVRAPENIEGIVERRVRGLLGDLADDPIIGSLVERAAEATVAGALIPAVPGVLGGDRGRGIEPVAERLEQVSEFIGPAPEDRNIVTDAAGALGQLAAQALAVALTGLAGGVGVSGALTLDEQVQRVAAAGAEGTLEGDIGIVGATLVSLLLDRVNLGALFEGIPESVRNRVVRALASGASEGTTEAAQAISSNLIARGVYDPDAGVFDGAAYEGFLGGFAGAVIGALTPGRPRAGGRGEEDEPPLPEDLERLLREDGLPTAQQRAEEAAASLETTRAAIEQTRTFARDPDAVRELLQEAGDQEVTIPAAEVDRLYQEGTLTDADIEYLQVEEELTQQGELSGDVSVAASRLLTLEGDSFSALVDNVRVRPDALTVAEARDAIANREADIERLQATLQQAQAEVTEVADLARRVADDLAQAAPQYTAGQRGAMGRLLAERYAARATLFGPEVTAQTLYAADLVTFQRQAAPGAQALEQQPIGAAIRPRMGEAFDDWLDRIYAPENRGPDNVVQDENVVFRAMSPEEAQAGEVAGVFQDLTGQPMYVANDPERYTGGGAYGGRRQGRIYEFDVTGIETTTRAGGVGIQDRAVQAIPADRVRRVWEWNPETQAHELIVDRTTEPDVLEQRAASVGMRTPEFERWFGDSKVVDDNGDPLVVYHGTTKDVQAFDPSRLGEATGAASARMGFFFSSSPAVASSYAAVFNVYRDTVLGRVLNRITGGLYERVNEAILNRFGLSALETGGNVMPLYLSIQNPAVYDFGGSEYRERTYADLLAEAKANGHDGMILRNTVDPGFGDGGDVVADVYVAFRPEQIKSVRNVGTFDPNDPRILNQPAEGPQTPERGQVGAPRGAYILPKRDGDANVFEFTTSADPSTFVHEVGHMFLYQMVRDLSDARLSETGRAQLEQQIRATRSWFRSNSEQAYTDLGKLAKAARRRADRLDAGLEKEQANLRALRLEAAYDRARQGGGAAYMQQVANAFLDPSAQGYDEAAEVVFHELWARGFEKYLGNGSAPSAALRTVFARFAKYIANVYRSLRQLNVEISPEVADVFDRLLATDAAIAEVRRGSVYRLSPGVLDGATPNEAQELRRLAAEAETEAMTQIARREQNALNQKARAQRAARREQLTADITEQVGNEPVYRAMELAATGSTPNGDIVLNTGKIRRREVIDAVGVEFADALPRRVVAIEPKDAIDLSQLALLSGFSDIDTMLVEMTAPNLRGMQDEIAARVDEQMQAEFGAETDPANLSDEAIEAAQNTRFQELQRLQLRILRRLAAEPLARVARRQAEQVGAPAAAADQAAEAEARAEEAAATSPREAVQANLARIRAQVQRQANVPQRRAQAAAGRQIRTIQRNVDPAVIQEAARRYVQSIEVRQATPARYQQTANRMSLKIERAIAARDYAQAADLMEQRALNLAIAREAADVQAMVTKQRRRWRDLTGRPNKRLAQSYDVNWVNAIRTVLEPMGFGRSADTNYSADRDLADLQEVEPNLYADLMTQISAAGRDAQLAAQADPKQPHRALTVGRLTEILELADQLLANARNSRGLLIEGRRVSFDKIASEVASYVDDRASSRRQADRPAERPSRVRETYADMFAGFGAVLRRVEIWARDMDNGDARGPMTRYLVRPIMASLDTYYEARLDPLKQLGQLLKDQKGLLKHRPIKADELAPGWSFRNKGELLMALANTGNESNFRKLLMGGGRVGNDWSAWTSTTSFADELDTSRWDAFFARAVSDGTITKADMDAVQGIWDIFERTKSGAQAAHQKMFGYRFVEIEDRAVATPFGTYRGGYVPAVMDRLMNPGADKFDAQEVMSQQDNASMFPGAERGFTEARTNATYVLDLDITRLPMHFDRVMQFTHLGPQVQQAARLINHPEFAAQVARVNPAMTSAGLIPWLQRTARQRTAAPATNVRGLRLLERGASVIDRRVGMHIMAANIKNAVEQLTGVFPALARVPAKHMIAAGTTWRLDGEGARRHVMASSPFMRERLQVGANETLNLIDNIMREPGLLNRVQDAAVKYSYFAQQIMANVMEPTIWLAAERDAMEKIYPRAYADYLAQSGDTMQADAKAKAEVYAYADEVVRSTQGSTRPSDVSGIEGTSALMRIFLRFYSFFNTQGNAFVAEYNISRNRDIGWAGHSGRALFAYAMILAIPGILSRLLGSALRGELDEMEDEEVTDLLIDQILTPQVEMVAGTVPFLGQAVSIAYGRLATEDPFDDRIRGSAGLSVASQAGIDVIDLIADLADPDTDVETFEGISTVLNATGLLIGLPTNWLAKPLDYAGRVQEGEADPEGMVDIIQGILTGRDGTED